MADISAMWDAEYKSGRYVGEAPVEMVQKVISTLKTRSMSRERGIYVGCGNGRNYVPLRSAGLALDCVDISRVAIESLQKRAGSLLDDIRVECGDFAEMELGPYRYVVTIQSLMHGMISEVQRKFSRIDAMLESGGLLFLRINSTECDVTQDHEILEHTPHGGYTIRYKDGTRRGITIHFFTKDEVMSMLSGYTSIAEFETYIVPRTPSGTGRWTQMEFILQKP